MLRIGEDLFRIPALHRLAALHDHDIVGHLAHDAEVVGDEQHGHAELGLQFLQQLQDLRLNGHVQRGGRFVGDQQVRVVGERHGDHHALALTAGQLVRIVEKACLGVADAHLGHQVDDAAACRLALEVLVQFEDLADLPLHRVQRVERGHRLLEHHGDVIAAHAPQVAVVGIEQLFALEAHRS